MNALNQELSELPIGKIWHRIGIHHHHGIDLPLSALRSQNSCGVGEIFDLLPLIDWCQSIHFDVIQLLPLNDSGFDPSPYNALSSCALHPLFLSLTALPHLELLPELTNELKDLQTFNLTPKVEFIKVLTLKLAWLKGYFAGVGKQVTESAEYIDFIEKNTWIRPYALFKVLKEKMEDRIWMAWPDELKNLSEAAVNDLTLEHHSAFTFHAFVQFLLFSQLVHVKAYAKARQVMIKGDIPILISADSADVWHHSDLFILSLRAGAPPDFYNKKGQYWGFPLFKWDRIKKNHFKWWRDRLHFASHFYDLYRLDHVLGFFRIWAMPPDADPFKGKFIPDDESTWQPHGKELLELLIDCSEMLPIAEDLGVVPPFVRKVLLELGICGTKVMRWERKFDEGGAFIPPEDYTPISLTCVSTHDSETLQQWWKKFTDEAKVFASYKNWIYQPDLTLRQRKEILKDSHHSGSLFHINLFQEYLALFPEMVWPSPEDERINVPGEILPSNWTYRFRPSIEEFTNHKCLKSEMINLIS